MGRSTVGHGTARLRAGRRRGRRGPVLGLVLGVVAALLPVLPGLGASPASAATTLVEPRWGAESVVGGWGNPYGGAPASARCGGYAVTSITGFQNTEDQRDWLNGITVDCSQVGLVEGAASVGAVAGQPGYGPRTDLFRSASCPAGAVGVGVSGRAGALVDSITLWCAGLDPLTGDLGEAAPAGTVGGTGGSAASPQMCAAGSVLTGFTGRAGDGLDFLSSLCTPLTFRPDGALHFTGAADGRVTVPFAFGSTPPTNTFTVAADVRWDGTQGQIGIVSQPATDGAGVFEGWSLLLFDGRPCLSLQLDFTTNRRLCPQTTLPVGVWTHLEASVSPATTTFTAGSVTASVDGTGELAVRFPASPPPFVVGGLFAGSASTGFGGDIDNVSVSRDWGDGYTQTLLSMSFDEGSGSVTTALVPSGVADGGALQGALVGTTPPVWVGHGTADGRPENTTWVTATTLTSGTPVTGALLTPGEARWYKLPVNPDGTVAVDLTNLPADYDVTLFKDIGQAFRTLTSPADLNTLSAEFAGDAFAPSIFSPSIFSPSIFSPSIFSPSIFSPSIFSPSIFSPSIFSPSIFSPSIFSPSIFSPDAFSPSIFSPSIFSPSIFSPSIFSPSIFSPETFSQAWSSAQTRSIVGYSARDGLADEHASAATWDNTGFYYVRVIGRNGASSPSPYRVTATFTGGSCDAPLSTFSGTDLGTFPATAVSGNAVRTVVLTDTSQLTFATPADKAAFTTSLTGLAGTTDGVVVDLADSPRVHALAVQADAQDTLACPYAKNLVAQAARQIVNGYRAADGSPGPLQYVVIAGGDDVVPFVRYPDASGLGPENGYVPPVADGTASQASLRRNTFLSQDAYGARVDVSVKGSQIPVPDVAVGRLVETPGQIEGTISQYVGGAQTIHPTSTLTTGYDFLTDAADAVAGTLSAGVGGTSNQTLIQPQGDDPATSWTADDLRAKLFGTRHDITYLAGHFSANSALAADYKTQIVTTEVEDKFRTDPAFFRNTLVVSAGCHSGYNLLDGDGLPGLTLGLDWAQAFAASGATLVAGTGYQYGDTDFLEYSERLYADFMTRLRTSPTGAAVPIGSALMAAKQQYLADTPVMSGIHTKALLESTLYGLPMLGMDMDHKITPPADASAVSAAPVAAGPGKVLGLQAAPLTLDANASGATGLATSRQTRTLDGTDGSTVTASFLQGPDGVVTNPAQPTLPLSRVDVTVPGQVLRGIGWRSGTYTDSTGITPLTGAATTELNAPHPAFSSPAFFPPRLATGNWFDAVANPGTGRTTLSVTPAQYRSTSATSTSATERRYGALGFELFYSSNVTTYGGNTPALAAPPTISGIDAAATTGATSVPVSAHVTGDPSAGVQKVWVTYTGTDGTPLHGEWASVDLRQSTTDSTLWTGEIPLPVDGTGAPLMAPGAVRFLVQAVNGVGLVSADDNGGDYWTPGGTAPVVAGAFGQAASTLTLSAPPASVAYGSALTASATLTGAGGALPGRFVRFGFGAASAVGVTGADGKATVTIPVTMTPGTVTLQAAFDGDEAAGGQAPATSGTAGVTVTKAPTALVLSGSGGVVQPGTASPSGVTATLTSDGAPLAQRTVAFTLGTSAGVTSVVTRTTDLTGTAALGSVTLPSGAYTVTAAFGGTVTLQGVATSFDDPSYASATATGALTSGTAPAFAGATQPPAGRVAAAYTPFAFTVTGTPAPVVSVTAGALPDGLGLSPSGVLSGTPTKEGAFAFTLTASNGVLPVATLDVTMAVTKAAPRTVTVVSGNNQVGTATQPFDKPLVTKVVDAAGAPIDGVPVAYTVTAGSASFRTASGTAKTVTVTTDASGTATSPALLAGTTAGPVTVSAVAGTTATGTASTTFSESVVSLANARSDLAVTLSAPASVARGATFTATVTVTNTGPNTAALVLTGFRAGSPLTVVTAPGATNISGVWTWSAATLPAGGSVTYTVTLRASTTKAATGTLSVATASLVPDPRLANNAATASVKIP